MMTSYRPAGDSDNDSDAEDDFDYHRPDKTKATATSFGATCVETPKPPAQNVNFHSGNSQGSQYGSQIGRGRGRGRGWSGSSSGGNAVDERSVRGGNSFDSGVPPPSGVVNSRKQSRKQVIMSQIPGLHLHGDNWRSAIALSNVLKTAWESVESISGNRRKFNDALKLALRRMDTEGKNLLAVGLFLMMHCTDFTSLQGKSEALAVIVGVQEYLKAENKTSQYLTTELQHLAFEAAVCQKKQNLVEAIFDVFQLSDPKLSVKYAPEIERMCSNKNFKEACICAMYFKLHSVFDIHLFLIPLLLQDRFNVVESYIADSPEIQLLVVKYLDGLFEQGSGHVSGTLRSYIAERKIPEVKCEKLDSKPISKLVKRLVSKFNIDFESCPNVGNRQKYGQLRHFFLRRYEKQEMNEESFLEIVYQIAGESQTMKEEVLNQFMAYYDYTAAANFIIAHNLYTSQECLNDYILPLLPDPIKTELQEQKGKKIEVVDESWDDEDVSTTVVCTTQSPMKMKIEESWEPEDNPVVSIHQPTKEYYIYPNLRDTIHIIDKADRLTAFCEHVDQISEATKEDFVVSGFDSEWKPIMTKSEGAALLQIAIESDTFIIDVIALKECLNVDSAHWTALKRSYFDNKTVMKLGFDIKNDMKMLTSTVPEWQEIGRTWKNIVDLSTVRTLILKEDPSFFKRLTEDSNVNSNKSGLSELVYLTLGKALSKAEQMSDWEKRPLRESQVLYAAGDAYCLIDVYKALLKLNEERHLDFNKIIAASKKGPPSSQGSRKKKAPLEIVLELLSKIEIQESQAIPPNFCGPVVRLVCDNMLQGLGRHLRAIGVDTALLDNFQCHSMCCSYARTGRIVLTKGVAFNEIVDSVPRNMLYNVKGETIVEQLQEICNQFGIALSPINLFTFCQNCNFSEFIRISKAKMLSLMDARGVRIGKRKRVEYDELLKERTPDGMILHTRGTARNWKLLDEETLKINEDGFVVTGSDSVVDLNKLLPTISYDIDWFYVCNTCGKIYWESEKLEKILREQEQTRQSPTKQAEENPQ